MKPNTYQPQLACTLRYVIPKPAPPPALAFVWGAQMFLKLRNKRGRASELTDVNEVSNKFDFNNNSCGPFSGAGPPHFKPLFRCNLASFNLVSSNFVVNFLGEKTMKRFNFHGPSKLKTLGLLAAGLVLGLSSNVVLAAGTASNTTISNLATINYSVGGVAQTAIGSSAAGNTTGAGTATTFVVDNKVNLTVIEKDATYTSVVPGQTAAVVAFTVTNNGNTVQDYSLASVNSAAGTTVFTVADNFDATGCSTFVESGATAGYQSAQDTATFIDELAADASKDVYVVCNIPGTQVNNDQAVIQLTATTATGGTAATQGAAVVQTAGANTAGVDIVFADPATAASVDGTIPLQTARDATGFARDAYRVVSALLTVSKTVAPLCDPLNGNTTPKNIPLGMVRWTITIANTGAASASLTSIADTLDSNTTFDPDLITGAGAGTACEFAAAGAGTAENANGRGFKITNSVARPFGGTAAGTATSSFFTTTSDADGAELPSATSVTFNLATAMPAGGTYTAGELKAGETLTIYFNVGIK